MVDNRDQSKPLNQIGEKLFLSMISHFVDTPVLDFNDDASAIPINDTDVLVINADMLVKQTDVLPGMSPLQIGRKVVSMSISDIVAKGVLPMGFLASIAFPATTEFNFAYDVIHGIKLQCNDYNIPFLGGDLNEGNDVIVDGISFGIVNRDMLLSRKGLEHGDLLYVTGLFGYTSLAFKMLLDGLHVPEPLKSSILLKVYEPKAQFHFLPLLRSGFVKTCIDSSDGLFSTLKDLAKANGLGISLSNIPISEDVLHYSEKFDLNPVDLALFGGEEYELVLGVKKSLQHQFESASLQFGLKVHLIGSLTKFDDSISISDSRFSNYNFPDDRIHGYDHFLFK